MSNVILVRYGEPNQYDHGPYGSICKVVKNMSEKFDIYVQIALDESKPQWDYVGAFDNKTDDDIIRHVEAILKS